MIKSILGVVLLATAGVGFAENDGAVTYRNAPKGKYIV